MKVEERRQMKGGAMPLMFLGTGSDVGKSIVTAAFCRIFRRRGYRTAPFKAQNMSNNSYPTLEGGEIGRAQVVQAEACGLRPSVHMNPVLLKPSTDMGSQVILHGRVYGQMEAINYHAFKPKLRRRIMESYDRLAASFDAVLMEGAGSCCEMNLKRNDLVNFPMARAVGAPCILVADIDRGGVFAQIIGSYHLMTPGERSLLIGFIINKFRGDERLFESGIDYIQKKTGRPVLGLVPFYQDILIDPEDSVVVQEDKRRIEAIGPGTVNIAVVRLPAISNFTDMEALAGERDTVVNYLFRPDELRPDYDCLILPGTKNTVEDAVWLGRTRWKRAIGDFALRGKHVLGICGGFQLLGRRIKDPHGVESWRETVHGVGILPVDTVLDREKIVREVAGKCLLNGKRVSGYEIHMGQSSPVGNEGSAFLKIHLPGDRRVFDDGWYLDRGRISGTYVHGLLDGPGFRAAYLNGIRRDKGLPERKPGPGRRGRFRHYDRLADHFERHCDVDRIITLTREFRAG